MIRMNAIELNDFLAAPFGVKPGTAYDMVKALRKAKLMSTGRQGPDGAAAMDNPDAVNLKLALALEHGRGESIPDNVVRARALAVQPDPPVIGARAFAHLGFMSAKTA